MKEVRHSLPSLVHLFKTIEEHERNVMSVTVQCTLMTNYFKKIFATFKRVISILKYFSFWHNKSALSFSVGRIDFINVT